MNKALRDLLDKEVNKASSMVVQSTEQSHGFLSTGFPFIDAVVSSQGLIPRGTITELMGLKSVCKTTLALHVLANAIALKGGMPHIVWADFENQLLNMKQYALALGVNIANEGFIHLRPPTLEEGTNLILNLVRTGDIDFVVIDSNAAMRPSVEAKNLVGGTHQKGVRSFLISEFIRNLVSDTNGLAGKGIIPPTVLILNHLYPEIHIGGPPSPVPLFDSPGSNAIKFYAAARLQLSTRGGEYRMFDNPYTHDKERIRSCTIIELFVEKCKVSVPHRRVKFAVRYGEGVDPIMSLILAAQNLQLIKKKGGDKGSRFVYVEPDGVESKSYPGIFGIYDYFRENHDVVLSFLKHPSLSLWESFMPSRLQWVSYSQKIMGDSLSFMSSERELILDPETDGLSNGLSDSTL